ncbi:hypothetical protein SAMN04487969_11879 [Paenibacillus algorifonticola]|uniref:Uncharacterized protein n=1 Tax=Paenibacillus algorifonticola TaxID=684063 RepID=A0A1I2GXA2_9BACL|nr:hypothetical protein [Paenibacillus algorifonticola]SFF21407.1 hypothetical protein SAMN04487969_11879 [Paenibacillus algorifonticola]
MMKIGRLFSDWQASKWNDQKKPVRSLDFTRLLTGFNFCRFDVFFAEVSSINDYY